MQDPYMFLYTDEYCVKKGICGRQCVKNEWIAHALKQCYMSEISVLSLFVVRV